MLFDAKALAAFEKAMREMKERGELAEAEPAEVGLSALSANSGRVPIPLSDLLENVRRELARYEHPLFDFEAHAGAERRCRPDSLQAARG